MDVIYRWPLTYFAEYILVIAVSRTFIENAANQAGYDDLVSSLVYEGQYMSTMVWNDCCGCRYPNWPSEVGPQPICNGSFWWRFCRRFPLLESFVMGMSHTSSCFFLHSIHIWKHDTNARHIIQYRATATLRRSLIKQCTASNEGGGGTKLIWTSYDFDKVWIDVTEGSFRKKNPHQGC